MSSEDIADIGTFTSTPTCVIANSSVNDDYDDRFSIKILVNSSR